jgi:hypothetical protein
MPQIRPGQNLRHTAVSSRQSNSSRLPREAIARVHFEALPWFGPFERLLELVGTSQQ